jgi:hypoxia up-regulated 1
VPLPAGVDSLLAVNNITGIASFAKETAPRGLGSPKIHLSFGLDSSGITSLIKAEATLEIPPTIEEKEEEEEEERKATTTENEATATANEATEAPENESNSTTAEKNSTAPETIKIDGKKKEAAKKEKKQSNILRRSLIVKANPKVLKVITIYLFIY